MFEAYCRGGWLSFGCSAPRSPGAHPCPHFVCCLHEAPPSQVWNVPPAEASLVTMFSQPQGLGHSELGRGWGVNSELRGCLGCWDRLKPSFSWASVCTCFSQWPSTVTSPQPPRGRKPRWILLLATQDAQGETSLRSADLSYLPG